MKRAKKHKIKHELPETSTSKAKDNEERDLAYYIHDRVELMHQVFSIIKPKELKSLTPDCVRHISLNDLQELCTEELLGISSKRLCAILDGAEPPTDTESSSSSLELETISLDSISSDDEILSEPNSKSKKHKHKKRKSKSKHRRRGSEQSSEGGEQARASRAGLTVLELLELQARARAIRAQLQQERKSPENVGIVKASATDDEVEIKEEPAEVVEISSDEEKPNVKELEEKLTQETEPVNNKVTKRINDLIITVPQSKQSRRIKLNRPKPVPTETSNPKELDTPKEIEVTIDKDAKNKKKQKKKQKTKEKDRDQDEIMLQLSDTEKMDLLEDFNRKDYDKVTTSEDSESSSDTDSDNSDEDTSKNTKENSGKDTGNTEEKDKRKNESTTRPVTSENDLYNKTESGNLDDNSVSKELSDIKITGENSFTNNLKLEEKLDPSKDKSSSLKDAFTNKTLNKECKDTRDSSVTRNNTIECEASNTAEEANKSKTDEQVNDESEKEKEKSNGDSNLKNTDTNNDLNLESSKSVNAVDVQIPTDASGMETNEKDMEVPQHNCTTENNLSIDQSNTDKQDSNVNNEVKTNINENGLKDTTNSNENEPKNMDVGEEGEIIGNLSDGEINENAEVVCISDEEVKKKKKKKKEKKSKREKSNFCEDADQNFYTESNQGEKTKTDNLEIVIIDDEVYELSDDSSCFEIEGTVLSEEPTTEEIFALSAKIDDAISQKNSGEQNEIEMSWKDRYLDSKKVKNVLNTSNILNALRKKNIELKRKLEEKAKENNQEVAKEKELIEGSIDHYNTLEGSTKYVDPITVDKQDGKATKEMEKDAKQLLRMYKKLFKYNDMNRQKDPNKKKKKKAKKKKDKSKDGSV